MYFIGFLHSLFRYVSWCKCLSLHLSTSFCNINRMLWCYLNDLYKKGFLVKTTFFFCSFQPINIFTKKWSVFAWLNSAGFTTLTFTLVWISFNIAFGIISSLINVLNYLNFHYSTILFKQSNNLGKHKCNESLHDSLQRQNSKTFVEKNF